MSNWSGLEHVNWLRKQSHAVWQSAEKAEDEKKKAKLTAAGRRLAAAADALEMLIGGSDPTDGIGRVARLMGEALKRGTRARVVLAASPAPLALRGTMDGMSRYQFFFVTDDGRRLVVEKQAEDGQRETWVTR